MTPPSPDQTAVLPSAPEPLVGWGGVDAPVGPQLVGRDAVLLFFSPSSIACLHALRTMEELLPRYTPQVALVGVHAARFARERDVTSMRQSIERLAPPIPVVHDASGELRNRYHVDALPTFVVLRRDGSWERHPGEGDLPRLRAMLDRVMAAGQASRDVPPLRLLESTATFVPTPSAPRIATSEGLRFPTVIKPLPGAQQRWAVADSGHHQIVLLDDRGAVQARFGSGTCGHRDGAATDAMFRSPRGLVCSADAIFVADTGNHAIRRIDVTEGQVTTVAGSGGRGYLLPTDPRASLGTALSSPWDLELDGSLVFFTNAGSHQIGAYNWVDRSVVRLAGSGGQGRTDGAAHRATLAQPANLALEESGERLFFTDSDSGRVRSLTLDEQGHVRTLASPVRSLGGELAGSSPLQLPLGLAWVDGELVVADSYNDRVLRISLDGASGVGPGPQLIDLTYRADPWVTSLPELREPGGIYAEDAERLLIVDTNNHRILHLRSGSDDPVECWPRS